MVQRIQPTSFKVNKDWCHITDFSARYAKQHRLYPHRGRLAAEPLKFEFRLDARADLIL